MENNIDVYVGGSYFRFKKSVLEQGKCSYLKQLVAKNVSKELYIDRPKDTFEAILTYHTTGKLHLPPMICPRAFQEELDYWQIPVQQLELCCYRRMLIHYREEKTLKAFLQSSYYSKTKNHSKTKLGKLRARIWNILEHQEKSLFSKIYFGVALVVIVMSIFSIALSTLPDVRSTKTEKIEDKSVLDVTTKGPPLLSVKKEEPDEIGIDYCRQLFIHFSRQIDVNELTSADTTIYEGTTQTNADSNSTNSKKHLSSTRSFNFVNIVPSLIPESAKDKIPSIKLALENDFHIYFYIECFAAVFFTIELIFRIFTCPYLKSYFLNILNLTEILLILANYTRFIFYLLEVENEYSITNVLLYIQALRVFRLLRIMRNITAFQVLSYSIKVGKKDLCVMFFYICIGLVIFSNIIYLVESSENFPSIPDAWWWSAVTITTLGYGDVTPKTVIGKCVGGICAISGVVLLSLIIPVFVNTFIFLYQFAGLDENGKLEYEKDPNDNTQETA